MILPIVAYGDPILKRPTDDIEASEELNTLIENMFDTMYNASGIGLAAPQIGESIRVFIVDTKQLEEKTEEFDDGIIEVFINAEIEKEEGELGKHEEGCLSIPDILADVERPHSITISYLDREFKSHTKTFDGFTARVIQHEYDHIEGILFTDRISPLKKKTLKKKLEKISKGKISPKYKMRFPQSV